MIKRIYIRNIKYHDIRGRVTTFLLDSIKKIGSVNPIIVRVIGRNKYTCINGTLRIKALKLLGKTTIKAEILTKSDDYIIKANSVKGIIN